MDLITSLTSFSIAAALMTMTPGIDTALVLRTTAVETGTKAMVAGAGISLGVLFWGILSAVGLGAVLAVSETAYLVLKIAGAGYLVWLGGNMLVSAFLRQATHPAEIEVPHISIKGWFFRGLFTNLLNPKIGVFYVSFLPQFMVEGISPVGYSAALAGLHGVMGLIWFAAIVLATRPVTRILKKPVVTRSLDSITGAVLIGFGLKLFLDERTAS